MEISIFDRGAQLALVAQPGYRAAGFYPAGRGFKSYRGQRRIKLSAKRVHIIKLNTDGTIKEAHSDYGKVCKIAESYNNHLNWFQRMLGYQWFVQSLDIKDWLLMKEDILYAKNRPNHKSARAFAQSGSNR